MQKIDCIKYKPSDIEIVPSQKQNSPTGTSPEIQKSISFKDYTLPRVLDEQYESLLAIRGFDKIVRLWHIGRLPNAVIEGSLKLYLCPYCGKYKTYESLRIDHIIPVKIYTKYKIYLAGKRAAKKSLTRAKKELNDILKWSKFFKESPSAPHGSSLSECEVNNQSEKEGISTEEECYYGEESPKDGNNKNLASITEIELEQDGPLSTHDENYIQEIDSDAEEHYTDIDKMNLTDDDICWEEAYYAALFVIGGTRLDRGAKFPGRNEIVRFFREDKGFSKIENFDALSKKAASNKKNLILCCHSCNSEKGGDFEDAERYIKAAINNTTDASRALQAKLSSISKIYDNIKSLNRLSKATKATKAKEATAKIRSDYLDEIESSIKELQKKKFKKSEEDIDFSKKLYDITATNILLTYQDEIDKYNRESVNYSVVIKKQDTSWLNEYIEKNDLYRSKSFGFNSLSQPDLEKKLNRTRSINFKPVNEKYIKTKDFIPKPHVLAELTEYEIVSLKEMLSWELPCDYSVKYYEGRVCFYCLGIYEIECFEIDHINSDLKESNSGYADPDRFYTAMNNFPSNLIPICKTCNTTKGKQKLLSQYRGKVLLNYLFDIRNSSLNRYGFVESLNIENGENITFEKAMSYRDELLRSNFNHDLTIKKLGEIPDFMELKDRLNAKRKKPLFSRQDPEK
ncbi:hypothetical protein [Pantoea ananatis]|uniref:hypothetical protein n=1 Tax=Pantoea ananas TaxID=553 RepID=UPI0021F7E7AE|nr:hypothetical protein [Pantoea ananatis]MCW0332733.1 hypothetical protein [Pantoea ananatis]